MLTSSCKAKARRLVQAVKDIMLSYAPDHLVNEDLVITSSGDNGEDLKMSPRARAIYPYSIECKNTQRINIWQAYEQAKTHVKDDRVPVVIFSRNRSEILICMKFEDHLKLTIDRSAPVAASSATQKVP